MMRVMTGTAGALALSLLLAACGGGAGSDAPTPTVPPAPSPPAVTAPAPPPVAVAPAAPDQCGARDLQHLIGRPRSEIPVPTNPAKRRVACTTCPMTMDYAPDRLNILFDAESGIIKDVKCG